MDFIGRNQERPFSQIITPQLSWRLPGTRPRSATGAGISWCAWVTSFPGWHVGTSVASPHSPQHFLSIWQVAYFFTPDTCRQHIRRCFFSKNVKNRTLNWILLIIFVFPLPFFSFFSFFPLTQSLSAQGEGEGARPCAPSHRTRSWLSVYEFSLFCHSHILEVYQQRLVMIDDMFSTYT